MENNQLPNVNFYHAKTLKVLGFDWPTKWYYCKDGGRFYEPNCNLLNWNIDTYSVSAPTVALAFKWIRDVIKIPHCITNNNGKFYGWHEVDEYKVLHPECGPFSTYEEAESALLNTLLMKIKKQQEANHANTPKQP